MNELTQRGIQALRAGNRSEARALLTSAVQSDPKDATAWLWLTGALDTDGERIACLRQVLHIDPGNAAAARGLKQILDRQAAGISTPAPAPEPAGPAGPSTEMLERVGFAAQPDQGVTAAPATAVSAAAAPAVEAAAAEAAAAAAAAAAEAPAAEVQPAPKRRRAAADDTPAQLIFRTRPSVAPALAAFWMFFIGVVIVGLLLRESPMLALGLSAALGVVLLAIVLYAVARNMAARYELTNRALTLRFRGKRVRIPVADLFAVECRQSALQKMLGTGDVLLDASVNGELSHLRMRNIPECPRRVKQIEEQMREARNLSR